MPKILVAGAGGAPSENVIKSLNLKDENKIIGMGSEIPDLVSSLAYKKYKVPYAVENGYKNRLLNILNIEKPDFVHFQNDIEIKVVSKIRDEIVSTGTKLFMPSDKTIDICVNKNKTAYIWEKEGIKVPKTILVKNENDLKKAFDVLASESGKIWLRATIGGGGKGALPTDNYDFARLWIDRYDGWGNFTAAEMLTENTVTWLSIWYEGELVVAQTRLRKSWDYGNRTLSGVTGITKVGKTFSDELVDKVAMASIDTVDKRPHGIYGVDMTYDAAGIPNPTEINISRFFTTVYFFTKAGLNMPQIYIDIALKNKFPILNRKINPLPDGLIWIRGMDREPMLTNEKEMHDMIIIDD